MRMQLGKLQVITALAYFATAADMLWTMLSGARVDENMARGGIATVCLVSGVLLLMGRTFPLRLMSASLFVAALFSLFLFSGFDESGLTAVNKTAITTALFSVAGIYLFFLRRFEAALSLQGLAHMSSNTKPR